MRRPVRPVLWFLCATLVAGAPLFGQRAPGPAIPDHVKGLWVPRTVLASAGSIASAVRAAQSGGFDTLLVQVRGRGEAFYRSAIEPRATDLDRQPDEFDPLATMLDLAHRAGLKVHAWVNVNLVASGTYLPRSRAHVASAHPEWLMVPRPLSASLKKMTPRSPAYLGALARWTRASASTVEGLYLSPIPKESQDYTTAVVRELVERYAIDGLHLDYVRYPNADFDYSAAAVAEFRAFVAATVPAAERQRLDRAAMDDLAAWPAALAAEWAAFRRDRLTSLVRRIHGVVRTARPAAIVSAAVFPSPGAARDGKLQDWVGWARAGWLDVACPMIYTTDPAEFSTLATEINAALGAVPFWAGIGAYKLAMPQTIEHVRLARRAQAAGVLIFSSEQPAEGGPSDLSALRPVLLEALPGSGPTR
jgi:uncharacterized lipoprotein YddW (UPF0748 family)